jgi:hypothetical protein
MSQAYAHAQTVSSQEPEYAVYIYHRPENQIEGQNDWEMRTLTQDLDAALREAKCLYQSRGYRKIEVKKRAPDTKGDCIRAKTLKVFDCNANKGGGKTRYALAAAFAAAAGLVASLWL